jgi:hypothetical protein
MSIDYKPLSDIKELMQDSILKNKERTSASKASNKHTD